MTNEEFELMEERVKQLKMRGERIIAPFIEQLNEMSEYFMRNTQEYTFRRPQDYDELCVLAALMEDDQKIDLNLNGFEKLYLSKIWKTLWFSNWSSGEHLKIMGKLSYDLSPRQIKINGEVIKKVLGKMASGEIQIGFNPKE